MWTAAIDSREENTSRGVKKRYGTGEEEKTSGSGGNSEDEEVRGDETAFHRSLE